MSGFYVLSLLTPPSSASPMHSCLVCSTDTWKFILFHSPPSFHLILLNYIYGDNEGKSFSFLSSWWWLSSPICFSSADSLCFCVTGSDVVGRRRLIVASSEALGKLSRHLGQWESSWENFPELDFLFWTRIFLAKKVSWKHFVEVKIHINEDLESKVEQKI